MLPWAPFFAFISWQAGQSGTTLLFPVEQASPNPFERHLRYRLCQSIGEYSVTAFKYNSGSPFKIKSAYATGLL